MDNYALEIRAIRLQLALTDALIRLRLLMLERLAARLERYC